MAAIRSCFAPLLKRVGKLNLTGSHVDRLCFRNIWFVPCRVQSVQCDLQPQYSAYSSETPVLNVREMDLSQNVCREQFAFLSGSIWVDRCSLHGVLEKSEDFQDTVFTQEHFDTFTPRENGWAIGNPRKDDFAKASLADIMDFIHFQINSMGREDFHLACRHIASRLRHFSDCELLEILKSLYFISIQGGNSHTLWTMIDEEILSRFNKSQNFSSYPSDFYLQVLDLLYWLNLIGKSSFAHHFLSKSMKRIDMRYPHGVQLLFYACCAPWEWRREYQMDYLVNFLNKIKHNCPFKIFLVAIESFTVLQFVRQTIHVSKNVSLPINLQRFLLTKVSENINDDNILIVVAQILYSCPSKTITDHYFYKLLNKISERNEGISFLVIFYVFQAMAKNGIMFDGFSEMMENCLFIDSVHPRVLYTSLLSLYGNFGSKGVVTLAQKVNQKLRKQDLHALSAISLLKMFSVLLDCGVEAFYMWETVIQETLASNLTEKKTVSSELLHMTADDCIEVFAPEYTGSRLGDLTRMQQYIGQCDSSYPHFPGFIEYLQGMTKGHVHATHILPGFTSHGLQDAVMCINDQGKFCRPCFDSAVKPWNVKKIPKEPSTSKEIYLAVWSSPTFWHPWYTMLKHGALSKLGYTSVMIDTNLWNSPVEIRDSLILSKLKECVKINHNVELWRKRLKQTKGVSKGVYND